MDVGNSNLFSNQSTHSRRFEINFDRFVKYSKRDEIMTGNTIFCKKSIQIRHALDQCFTLHEAYDLLESYGVSPLETDAIIRAWERRQNSKLKGVRHNGHHTKHREEIGNDISQ